MTLSYHPYDTNWVRNIRSGGPDANGQPAERAISTGSGNPCRHCLKIIPEGADMLICAARPFPEPQPYAELGPIFLCADDCDAYSGTEQPEVLQSSPDYLVKGYTGDHRISYGTGQITAKGAIKGYCETLFENRNLAYIDVRSARNNCFLTRITRKDDPAPDITPPVAAE